VSLGYNYNNNNWFLSGGFEVKLIHTLSKHFNFTYSIINCNSDWGTEWPNKTWTGIVGKIANKVNNSFIIEKSIIRKFYFI
jgi:hypothetical protein